MAKSACCSSALSWFALCVSVRYSNCESEIAAGFETVLTCQFFGGGSNVGNSNVGSGNAGGVSRKSDTIIIKNVPMSCTWQTLRDKFREIGDVKFAEIRGNDVGVVRFFKERDAELAIGN